MDEKTVFLTPEAIVEKQFDVAPQGYNPDQVDEYLDQIIKDYFAYRLYVEDAKAYIQALETQLRALKEELNQQAVNLAKAENRIAGIQDAGVVDSTNIDLLRYIERLEKALYLRGVNPVKLKEK